MEKFDINIEKSTDRIKTYCKNRKIKQIELANIIGYSSRNEVSKVLNGRGKFYYHQYETLAEYFNCRVDFILGISDFETDLEYHKNWLAEIKEQFNKIDNIELLLEPILELYGKSLEKTDISFETTIKFSKTESTESGKKIVHMSDEYNNNTDLLLYKDSQKNISGFITRENLMNSIQLFFKTIEYHSISDKEILFKPLNSYPFTEVEYNKYIENKDQTSDN